MRQSVATALRRHPGAVTFRFCDSAAPNAEVIDMVRAGRKTACCGALAGFAKRGEALPQAGRVDIALDWDGRPQMAIRTEKVERIRFCDMDEGRIEPQGNFRDLAAWRVGYEACLRRAGYFAPDGEMVIEWFRVEEDFG